jgi:hypothetical protein
VPPPPPVFPPFNPPPEASVPPAPPGAAPPEARVPPAAGLPAAPPLPGEPPVAAPPAVPPVAGATAPPEPPETVPPEPPPSSACTTIGPSPAQPLTTRKAQMHAGGTVRARGLAPANPRLDARTIAQDYGPRRPLSSAGLESSSPGRPDRVPPESRQRAASEPPASRQRAASEPAGRPKATGKTGEAGSHALLLGRAWRKLPPPWLLTCCSRSVSKSCRRRS